LRGCLSAGVSIVIATRVVFPAMRCVLRVLHVAWLVALIALPCTAPFSTCELADLLAADEARPHRAPHPHDVSADRALPHQAAASGRSTSRARQLRAVTGGTAEPIAVRDATADVASFVATALRRRAPLHRVLRI
jgi:hypothetical protein